MIWKKRRKKWIFMFTINNVFLSSLFSLAFSSKLWAKQKIDPEMKRILMLLMSKHNNIKSVWSRNYNTTSTGIIFSLLIFLHHFFQLDFYYYFSYHFYAQYFYTYHIYLLHTSEYTECVEQTQSAKKKRKIMPNIS